MGGTNSDVLIISTIFLVLYMLILDFFSPKRKYMLTELLLQIEFIDAKCSD